MSIFDRWTGRDKIAALAQEVAALKAKAAQYPGWALGAAEAERWNMGDGSQYDSQIDLYGKVTGINSAIEIYSALCAATALNVYQVNGEDETDIPNHPFEMLLDDPNPLMSRFEFMQATFAFLRLVGNCYWWLNIPKGSTTPPEIWVMPPNQVTPIPDGVLFLKNYEYRPGNGNTYEIPVEQVVHFKAFNPGSVFIGMGKAQPLFMTAETDTNMVKYNANYFGKDNAKVPGMLAYSDSIAQPIWDQMKKDLRAQWGGVNRSGPLFAQNVGKGVNWLAMGATQDEMQFLQSRQLSREEMFASIAPGLASILAINATEANAKTGKATLTDLAMWPSMVAIAQRITKSVLPLYGVNLRAKFEDIRVTDRALAIQEIDQYARFFTMADVRKDKFNKPPFGDERDNLLVSQVQPPAPVAPAPAPVTMDANPPASIPVSNWPVANPAAKYNENHDSSSGEFSSGGGGSGGGGAEKITKGWVSKKGKKIELSADHSRGEANGLTVKIDGVEHPAIHAGVSGLDASGKPQHVVQLTDTPPGTPKTLVAVPREVHDEIEAHRVKIKNSLKPIPGEEKNKINAIIAKNNDLIASHQATADTLDESDMFQRREKVEHLREIQTLQSNNSGLEKARDHPMTPDELRKLKESNDLAEFVNSRNYDKSIDPNSIQSDLSRWQTKALKRLKERGAAVCPFESEVIPSLENERIAEALKDAKTPEAVKAIFAQDKADPMMALAAELKRANDLLERTA